MRDKVTIGFFVSVIDNVIGDAMFKGAIKKARKENINLICFNGGNLAYKKDSVIYDMFSPELINGIFCWAFVNQDVDPEIFKKYLSVPFVVLSLSQHGLPLVTVDTYTGMKEIVEHYIKVHKFTKIAFIRGPDTHMYAQQRYQAYLDTLKSHKINVDNNLITAPGLWTAKWAHESIDLFCNKRGLKPGRDIEAIICVSDAVAIPAVKKLQEMGFKVPQEIAVSGYNDSIDSRCSTPPLTTADMPFMQQSEKAIEMLLSLLEHKEVSKQEIFLPSKLVLRQSCGCFSSALNIAAKQAQSNLTRINGLFSKIISNEDSHVSHNNPSGHTTERENIDISALLNSVLHLIDNENITKDFISKESQNLLSAFYKELHDKIPGLFLNVLSDLMTKTADKKGELEIWYSIISVMRGRILHKLRSKFAFVKAEVLFQQALILIGEASTRSKMAIDLERSKFEDTLRNISAKIITNFDVKKLMDVLVESLPLLKIPSCFVVLNEKSDAATPQWAKLVMAYNKDGRITLEDEGRRFEVKNFLPQGFLPQNRTFNLVVESLLFQNEQQGYVIFEIGPEDGSIYVSLSNLLSSALYGALLLERHKEVKNVLQITLQKMHGKAQVVSDASTNISTNVDGVSASMEEVAVSTNEMSRTINTVMDSINNAVQITRNANKDITNLTEDSRKISEIVNIIDDITDETSTLALNAAIQAARAGSAGEGFNVVAKEIKNLAQKTVLKTNEINEMIEKAQLNTSKTADAINNLMAIINQVSELSSTITSAINQQALTTNEISKRLIEAAGGSKNISQAISEVASLGDDLNL